MRESRGGRREPFRILMKDFEEEAELHLVGRLRTRSEILQLLEARLQIEDWYKRHPEIDEQEIVAPLMILGLPRTGSTHLHALLATRPGTRSPAWARCHRSRA